MLDGDSRMLGPDGVDTHPVDKLLKLTKEFVVFNEAVGGSVTSDLISRGPEKVDPYLIEKEKLNIVVVWAGINDVAHSRWHLPANIPFENLKTYCLDRKAKGWKVIICTEISVGGVLENGVCDQVRIELSDMTRRNWRTFADGLADLGANLTLGAIGAYHNEDIFVNELHLTEVGTNIVAGIISKAVNDLAGGIIDIDPEEPPAPTGMQRLKTSGHILVTEDGKPFFWLGDTPWLLLYQLTLNQIATYLDNRKAKGFNVIQVMVMSSLHIDTGGAIPANLNGDVPLLNENPVTPNPAFFSFVDQVVALAESKGIYVALLPTWGAFVSPLYNIGPKLFDASNALIYGRWIGNRYKDCSNVIWMLGGDRPAKYTQGEMGWGDEFPSYDVRPVWDAMANGILSGSSNALITYHSGVHRSSFDLHDKSWLHINTIQSGHSKDVKSYEHILSDYQLLPVKAVINVEPCYEQTPADGDLNNRINAFDVRMQFYFSVFSGACGHVYGNINIYQFYSSTFKWDVPNEYWITAMDRVGAFQVGYGKKLMENKTIIPDQSVILSGQGTGADHMVSCRNNQCIMVYMPIGKMVTVKTSLLPSNDLKYSWMNPRTGQVGEVIPIANYGRSQFNAPDEKDCVLIIETQ